MDSIVTSAIGLFLGCALMFTAFNVDYKMYQALRNVWVNRFTEKEKQYEDFKNN